MKKLLCKFFGHRSIMIFSSPFRHTGMNWMTHTTVHKCERCGEETKTTYQGNV